MVFAVCSRCKGHHVPTSECSVCHVNKCEHLIRYSNPRVICGKCIRTGAAARPGCPTPLAYRTMADIGSTATCGNPATGPDGVHCKRHDPATAPKRDASGRIVKAKAEPVSEVARATVLAALTSATAHVDAERAVTAALDSAAAIGCRTEALVGSPCVDGALKCFSCLAREAKAAREASK